MKAIKIDNYWLIEVTRPSGRKLLMEATTLGAGMVEAYLWVQHGS